MENTNFANLSSWTLKVGFLTAVVFCSIFVTQSSMIATYPYVGTAVTIDMLISLPIAYFFFIRKTAIPKYSVFLVFGLAAVTLSFLLPPDDRDLFNVIALYVIPAVELFAIAFVGWRMFRARQSYLSESLPGRDLFERLRDAFTKELRPAFAARAAAFELSAFVYAFLKWRTDDGRLHFTYHKKNGSTLVLALFLFILAAETVVLHFLIANWSGTAALIATAASIYFGFQIFAHLKALSLRPINLTETELLFRCGLLGDASIDLDSITRIDTIESTPPESKGSMIVRPLGAFSQVNIRIFLQDEAVFSGLYGTQHRFTSLSFYVDEPKNFVETATNAIRAAASITSNR